MAILRTLGWITLGLVGWVLIYGVGIGLLATILDAIIVEAPVVGTAIGALVACLCLAAITRACWVGLRNL